MTSIFISHSHSDSELANKLLIFLLFALKLEAEEILCSSNPDQGLSLTSSSVTDQLKTQLIESEILIVLIIADSLNSAWIPFEVGAFWTTDKLIIPILGPGLEQDDLPGPLKSFLSIPVEVKDFEGRVNNFINQIVKRLKIEQRVTQMRTNSLEDFSNYFRFWKSKFLSNISYQERIQELTSELEKVNEKNRQLEIQLEQKNLSDSKSLGVIVENKVLELEGSFTEDLGNGIKLEMVPIPRGKFMMGSPIGKGNDNERPQHEVILGSFYIGKYPVTQEQYEIIMGKNPSYFSVIDNPVENVSWIDAIDFCNILSGILGRRYFLPSEAEWEYACRAGTNTSYYFGRTITDRQANFGNNFGETTFVRRYKPNSFGLYDMHGNVWEWCQDDWYDNYQDAPNNVSTSILGVSNLKVMRGGSWRAISEYCRSASRISGKRNSRDIAVGFRVACIASIN